MREINIDLTLSFQDMAVLENLLRKYTPGVAVEIGSWKGLSSIIIGRWSKDLYCVDTWKGSPNVQEMWLEAEKRDIFSIFCKNMQAYGLDTLALKMTSAQASRIFADSSVDFVFIDGNHAYSQVSNDIHLWLPKLKPYGVMAGHDLEWKWEDCSEEVQKEIMEHLEDDLLEGVFGAEGLHPGVTRAVHERFGTKVQKKELSTIWWIEKSQIE